MVLIFFFLNILLFVVLFIVLIVLDPYCMIGLQCAMTYAVVLHANPILWKYELRNKVLQLSCSFLKVL